MLYNKEFLKRLDLERNKTIYGRITALQFNEQPIQSIEGRITGGSINIDGASAVRRTCSLTMVASDVNINGYYWGLNTKFKLEVGVKNTIDKNYPDIIWFKQGIFIITSFSTALSTTNYTINLQGKDKMCLLNGEIGGTLTASTVFDSWDQETNTGDWITMKYPIKDIIRSAVHQFAGEPFHNIIINDLEDQGLELLEYRYDKPLYLLRAENSDEYTMGTLNPTTTTPALDAETNIFDPLYDHLPENVNPTPFIQDNNIYHAAKISYGETAGFRLTDLIYPDELIGNVGESITSILDKIKNLLGQFEYFYDVDGRFIFQKKQDFINTVWTPVTEEGFIESGAYSTSTVYSFTGNELITAFNNAPNLNNLRNDYSVWGARKGADGGESLIHMRYAIDEKPSYYKAYDGTVYTTDNVDWREIIFQMQKDYRQHHFDDDFMLKIIENNPNHYPTGQTGYEQYYIDLEGFWRQLYYPNYAYEETIKKYEARLNVAKAERDAVGTADRVLFKSKQDIVEAIEKEKTAFEIDYVNTYYPDSIDKNNHPFWNRAVYEDPDVLNYWIDFLDADGELNQFSCKSVGCRPKAVNDNNVKSIYFRETPNIIFASSSEFYEEQKSGYRYFQAPNAEHMFSISTQGKSAKDVIDELLYQHAYCVESATITAIPVYYLQPNTRIYVYDKNSGISGDYIVSKITLPLTYNGTMSLTATKAAERII